MKKGKLEKKFAKFLDIFKKLHINIPFMDALENMLSYVKFMKKILVNKKKFGEYETILFCLPRNAAQSSTRSSHQNFKIWVVLPYHSLLETRYQVKLFVTWEQV